MDYYTNKIYTLNIYKMDIELKLKWVQVKALFSFCTQWIILGNFYTYPFETHLAISLASWLFYPRIPQVVP